MNTSAWSVDVQQLVRAVDGPVLGTLPAQHRLEVTAMPTTTATPKTNTHKTNRTQKTHKTESRKAAPTAPSPKQPNEGEGNRTAARRYDAATEQYIASGRTDAAAKAALEAVEGPEGDALRAAEEFGKKGEPKAKRRS
jgi:hypothetical protein